MNLQELKVALLADGVIDKEEVAKLKEVLYADGAIDKEEADILFEINDAVSGKGNDESWESFFVQAITDFLLEDEASFGEIDADEVAWLIEKIGADGKVDGSEKALLQNLKAKAKVFPEALNNML